MSALSRMSFAVLVSILLLSGGCVVVTGFGSPKHWVEAVEEFSVASDGIDELFAMTHNGSISIEGTDADTDEILITASIKAGGRSLEDADECLDSIVIDARREGSVQKLGWRYDPKRKSRWSATVSFRVLVPRRIAVETRSHNGRLSVQHIEGPVTAETHNGRVVLKDVKGQIEGQTHNGRIEAHVSTDQVRLLSHNGRIKVWVESFGSISGRIETHNGQVEVGFAGYPNTDLFCKTHNGSISSELELLEKRRSKRSLSGRIGKGGGRLTVETHNGGIRIHDAGIDRSF